ncbi:EamA/RhaT family transporter, partial [Francisella tularensis subsp. holarctica]|nr:EamA/RhaT family transporter [Francisella tularensis subsp. holarctica]
PLILRAKFKNKLYKIKVVAIFRSHDGLSFYLQKHGLYTVSSSQSAFLTALIVVMIPFIGSQFKVYRLKIYGIIDSCVSMIVIYSIYGA